MALNYKLIDGAAGAPTLDASDSTAKFNPGTVARGKDFGSGQFGEAEFKYVKFTGTVAAGDFVLIDDAAKTAVQLTGAVKGLVGISMAAQTANQFGWALIRGVHDAANVATGAAAGARLYSSATGGRASSSVVAGQSIDGAVERVLTSASNVGTVELNWPNCSGNG